MCNEATRRIALGQLRDDCSETGIPLRFPEGLPNMEPLDSIRITDASVIIRASSEAAGEAEVVTRRWSWPGPTGRPVYNFRSDGRSIATGRCLVPVDGFFEFTSPPGGGRGPKSKWRFGMAGQAWFCIAGVWRRHDQVGEAWSMLTTEPGPDMAPYHDRQVVVLGPADYARWLDVRAPSCDLCRPAAAGTLTVEQVR